MSTYEMEILKRIHSLKIGISNKIDKVKHTLEGQEHINNLDRYEDQYYNSELTELAYERKLIYINNQMALIIDSQNE